jgi:hypothetical protein
MSESSGRGESSKQVTIFDARDRNPMITSSPLMTIKELVKPPAEDEVGKFEFEKDEQIAARAI